MKQNSTLLLMALALALVPHNPETGLPIAYTAAEWTMAALAWAGVVRSARAHHREEN